MIFCLTHAPHIVQTFLHSTNTAILHIYPLPYHTGLLCTMSIPFYIYCIAPLPHILYFYLWTTIPSSRPPSLFFMPHYPGWTSSITVHHLAISVHPPHPTACPFISAQPSCAALGRHAHIPSQHSDTLLGLYLLHTLHTAHHLCTHTTDLPHTPCTPVPHTRLVCILALPTLHITCLPPFPAPPDGFGPPHHHTSHTVLGLGCLYMPWTYGLPPSLLLVSHPLVYQHTHILCLTGFTPLGCSTPALPPWLHTLHCHCSTHTGLPHCPSHYLHYLTTLHLPSFVGTPHTSLGSQPHLLDLPQVPLPCLPTHLGPPHLHFFPPPVHTHPCHGTSHGHKTCSALFPNLWHHHFLFMDRFYNALPHTATRTFHFVPLCHLPTPAFHC